MDVEGLIYDTEREWVEADLDLAYIGEVAEDVARALRVGKPAEVAFQPGDGTLYGFVFTPLTGLVRARPRTFNGRESHSNAIGGMGFPEYEDGGYLVSKVEGRSYPLRLGHRGVLAASYVGEHWDLSEVSAVSVALLFRAISAHLDALALHSV